MMTWQLTSFLDDLKVILERFVNEYLDGSVSDDLKEFGLLPIFRKSFPGVKRSLVLSINKLNEPNVDLLGKFDEHGLRGDSLTLKIEIVNTRKKQLEDEIKQYEKLNDTQKPGKLSKLKGCFHRFLGAADIPLESLANCIPGLGTVVEFKKAIEHVTTYSS